MKLPMPEQNDAPILIVDLEATCWESSRLPNGERQSIGNMEIIEFGCALATRTGELLDSRSFLVRPVRNPDLSAFCRSLDRNSTRLNSSHVRISYAVFC